MSLLFLSSELDDPDGVVPQVRGPLSVVDPGVPKAVIAGIYAGYPTNIVIS